MKEKYIFNKQQQQKEHQTTNQIKCISISNFNFNFNMRQYYLDTYDSCYMLKFIKDLPKKQTEKKNIYLQTNKIIKTKKITNYICNHNKN